MGLQGKDPGLGITRFVRLRSRAAFCPRRSQGSTLATQRRQSCSNAPRSGEYRNPKRCSTDVPAPPRRGRTSCARVGAYEVTPKGEWTNGGADVERYAG